MKKRGSSVLLICFFLLACPADNTSLGEGGEDVASDLDLWNDTQPDVPDIGAVEADW